MKNKKNYSEIVRTYGNVRKEERTLEGALERLNCMANTAMQLREDFIHHSTIWWVKSCPEEAKKLVGKEIRISKDGGYPVFYLLQYCYAVEKSLEKKGLSVKSSYSSYRKSKKNFDFTSVTLEELTKTAAKEKAAIKRIKEANK